MQQLASGNVPVKYETLPGGFAGTDETVKRMTAAAMGRYGARSPKIRALARNILVAARAPEKNYEAEAVALGNWVKNNIRYMKDVYGQETLSYPEEVAFNMKAGDCDDQCTLLAALLGAVGIPSRFKVIGVTPHQYSHVYLQTKPKNRWITMDPIMQDKPIGWEAPVNKRVIEKVYPVNMPADARQGVQGMQGLGYVGDPRIASHLDRSTIPASAGTGRRPARVPSHPAYVKMPSGLDTDADITPLMAFPMNQNVPRQYPQQRAKSVAPTPQRLTNQGTVDAMDPAAEVLEGYMDVIGPEQLADLQGKLPPDDLTVPPYMQTKTVAQTPEGVDAQFGRAAMVVDPMKGDKIDYYGHYDKGEKPPIQAYTNVAGMDAPDMLPGMGYLASESLAGPGMGAEATGNEAVAPTAPGDPSVPEVSTAGKWMTAAVMAAVGLYLVSKMRK